MSHCDLHMSHIWYGYVWGGLCSKLFAVYCGPKWIWTQYHPHFFCKRLYHYLHQPSSKAQSKSSSGSRKDLEANTHGGLLQTIDLVSKRSDPVGKRSKQTPPVFCSKNERKSKDWNPFYTSQRNISKVCPKTIHKATSTPSRTTKPLKQIAKVL